MNITTKKFIEEFREAYQKGDESAIKALLDYLKFDYRIKIEELEKHLPEEQYSLIINNNKKKNFNHRQYIEDKLIDEAAYLAYKFFKSKYGRKIVDKLTQKVVKDLKENNVPEAYHKREIDRIINYKITLQKVFQKSFPLFLKYLSRLKIV